MISLGVFLSFVGWEVTNFDFDFDFNTQIIFSLHISGLIKILDMEFPYNDLT